jgi:hypothetical protein
MGRTTNKSKDGTFQYDRSTDDVIIWRNKSFPCSNEKVASECGKIRKGKIEFDTLPMHLTPEELMELAEFIKQLQD